MSVLVICKNFRLFVKTLTPDDKYFFCNSEILAQPIQILVSTKQQTISQFFPPFVKSTSNFKQFEEMTTLIVCLFLKLQIAKELVRLTSKKPVTKHLSTDILLKISKRFRNLHLFPKWKIPKDWVKPISKKPHYKTRFDSHSVKNLRKHLRNLHDSTSLIFFMTLGKIELENLCVSNM